MVEMLSKLDRQRALARKIVREMLAVWNSGEQRSPEDYTENLDLLDMIDEEQKHYIWDTALQTYRLRQDAR